MKCRRARPLLGTLVEIAVRDADPRMDIGRAFEAAFAAVQRVHRLMSAHDAASDVSRINRSNPGDPVTVDPWTYQVIEAALEVSSLTCGLFDPCVAPLLQQAGLLPDFAPERAKSQGDYRALRLAGECSVEKLAPLQLTLDGIAKGFAVDRATEALQSAGVTAGAVNAGGDLRIFGPDAQAIHLRDPVNPERLFFIGHLREGSIATSGGCLSRRAVRDRALPHIFDPRTRIPVAGARSASVIARECLFADALAKAVLLDAERAGCALARFHATPIVLGEEALRRAA